MAACLYSILLPTYNECENLPILAGLLDASFREAKEGLGEIDFEVVVVDDNSPDGTFAVATNLAKRFPFLKVYRREKKLGLGSAYVFASQHAAGEFVFIMDADLSHHPKYLSLFIKRQAELNFDIVSGSRYCGKNAGVCGWPLKRRLTSVGANVLARRALGISACSDVTGSYRLYKRGVFNSLIKACTTKGYAFQMEIIMRAHLAGHRIGEVPIVFVERLFGTSKLGLGEVAQFLKSIWQLLNLKDAMSS